MTQLATLPADPPTLRGRSDVHRLALETLFSKIGEVSSLPSAALRVIQIANDETSGASDLLRAVEGDPAFAVKMLRTVNSSLYSVRHRVNDLRTAIALLGVKQVRNLALTMQVARVFRSQGDYRTFSRERLWKHQVAVATTARMVAEVSKAAHPDEAYLAGLLHDMGFVFLDQHLRKDFRQVLDRLDVEHPSPTCAVERELLTFDHAELGEFVMRRWNLPPSAPDAAGYHHAPDTYTGPHSAVVHLVAVANYFCTRRGISSLGVENIAPPNDASYRALGLDSEQVGRVIDRLDDTLSIASATAAL